MTEIEKEKFLNLLKPVYRQLERFALSIARDYDSAKDIVSETVLEALEGYAKLRNEKAFLSYLFTIAKRKQIDYYRKNGRMNAISSYESDNYPSYEQSPEKYTDTQLLREAMKELDDDSREALVLFEFSGFRQSEIAEIQGTTVSNIKVRILKILLEGRDFEKGTQEFELDLSGVSQNIYMLIIRTDKGDEVIRKIFKK